MLRHKSFITDFSPRDEGTERAGPPFLTLEVWSVLRVEFPLVKKSKDKTFAKTIYNVNQSQVDLMS